jgi:hypothetical protein
MKNYKLLSMLGLGLILFGSWGCAKDQTVAEYDSAQAAKQAAQNLPAVALWVGPVTDSNNSTMGMIQLNLENQSQAETAADNTTTQMTVLGGQAELTTLPDADAQVTLGNFIPDSDNSSNGTLTATITAKDANGNAETLTLTGTISGNTMTGQIQVQGEATQMSFVATKGASASSQNLVISSNRMQFENQPNFSTLTPVSMSGNVCGIFNTPPSGQVCEEVGQTCSTPSPAPSTTSTCGSNIEMAIIENSPNDEVNFYNAFTDTPTVQVDLNYYVPLAIGSNISLQTGQTITADDLFIQTHLQFTAVTLDLVSHTLSGTGTTATGGTSRLDCSSTSTSKGQGWSCNINNSGTSLPPGVVFAPGQLAAGQN